MPSRREKVGGAIAAPAYRTYRCPPGTLHLVYVEKGRWRLFIFLFAVDEDAVGLSHRDSGRRVLTDSPNMEDDLEVDSISEELVLSGACSLEPAEQAWIR